MFWWLAGSEPDCQTSGSSPTIFKSYTAFDLGLKEEAQATQGVSWHFIHFDNGKTRVWPVHWSIFNIFQAASWRWLNVDECDSIYIYIHVTLIYLNLESYLSHLSILRHLDSELRSEHGESLHLCRWNLIWVLGLPTRRRLAWCWDGKWAPVLRILRDFSDFCGWACMDGWMDIPVFPLCIWFNRSYYV